MSVTFFNVFSNKKNCILHRAIDRGFNFCALFKFSFGYVFSLNCVILGAIVNMRFDYFNIVISCLYEIQSNISRIADIMALTTFIYM